MSIVRIQITGWQEKNCHPYVQLVDDDEMYSKPIYFAELPDNIRLIAELAAKAQKELMRLLIKSDYGKE